ncbi:MAG: GAF domain-containing protein [Chloroflexi bacterium]|nr:GAF domain-containing protein [Chloroflexota bacterium]
MSSATAADLSPEDELIHLRARVTELEAQHAQLVHKVREEHELAEVLRDIAGTLNSTLSLTEVFDRILSQLLRLVPYDAANVIVLDEAANSRSARIVREHVATHLNPEPEVVDQPFEIDQLYYLQQMWQTGQACVVTNTATDAHWADQPRTRWVRSWLGAPIRIKGRVIGFLSVKSATPDFFRARQADRVQVLADQAAIAIDNARLFEDTWQRLLQIEVLYDYALVLSQLMTPQQIGQKIIDLVVSKLNWHHSTVRLYHPAEDTLELLAFSQPDIQSEAEAQAVEARFKTLIARPGQGFSGWVVEHGQVVRCGDVGRDPRYLETFPGLQSGLYVPLKIGDRVLGVISIESEQANAFDEADERLATTLATQAAIALENALLYEQVNLYTLELEERIQARTAELDHERLRLQTILDSAGEAIFMVGSDGRIQFANAATAQLTGFSIAELLGQSPAQLFRSGLTNPAVLRDMEDHIRLGQSWQGELIDRHKDDTLYETEVTLTPITGPVGQPQGYIVINRDITAHKELDRLKSQFVSRIGHELRTPLSTIMLNLELLEHGKPERQTHYRQVLTAGAERLRRLVEAFFQMAELDAGIEQPDTTAINLNLLAQDIAIDHIDRALELGLTIDLRLDPTTGAAPILSDAQWLQQAISIVLDNALKYTTAPGTVTISTAVHAQSDRTWYTLTIRDTGPGLTPEELPHIFDRFYRGSAASRYTIPGTGLGLAIAQAIMAKLGGQITVENALGRGAAFTLWLRPQT